MPIKFVAITCILTSITICSFAQSIRIQNGINLPQDTAISSQLIRSLNGFLSQKEKPNKENSFVLKDDLLETSALLDEIKGVEQNAKLKDKDFYKSYLSNVVKLDETHFMVQLSYIGMADSSPLLRASFKLLAKREGTQFYFYSPLKQNTIGWKTKKLNNIIYRYKDTLNAADAKAYQTAVNYYDKKLKAPNFPVEFYYCDDFPEVLQVLGVEYKADYNGAKSNVLTAHENNVNLTINGWNSNLHRFDPHDLWHERLRAVMSSDVINRPVDEGCAYLYGGSWGYSWTEVLTKFKKYAADNSNADWLNLYIEVKNFEGGEKPLKVPYMLNALIAQKIEKEKGFAAVMELLRCGKKEQGDENYFKALEKITGISKGDFNAKMRELIKGA
ncbi:MAG TPA: hypothetical protein VK668_20400 [Mucilaginibacter sp.]|nr:hypothetical protein [Mucilaginibacter sp.]